MPLKSYKAGTLILHTFHPAEAKLGVKPFQFQLEIAAAIL
jgi:hypothetical protein